MIYSREHYEHVCSQMQVSKYVTICRDISVEIPLEVFQLIFWFPFEIPLLFAPFTLPAPFLYNNREEEIRFYEGVETDPHKTATNGGFRKCCQKWNSQKQKVFENALDQCNVNP